MPLDGPWTGIHALADDDPRWPRDPVEQARRACAGGAAAVQLRAKYAGDQQVIEWGRAIRAITARAGVRFVVNDRFDLALLCDADAVHLGQDDLPPSAIPAEARRRLGVGRSTHDPHQAAVAARDEGPLAYVAFGPLFGTTSKDSPYTARGLRALAEVSQLVAEAAALPVVAIGGIAIDNVADVVKAGASGVAVISAVAAVDEPDAAVRALVDRFDAARLEVRETGT